MEDYKAINLNALSSDLKRLLNQVALENQALFVQLIMKMGQGLEDNIDWWVSGVASRNTLSSSLFLNCCYFAFIKQLIEQRYKFNEVIVESIGLARTLEGYFSQNSIKIKVTCTKHFLKRLQNKIKPFYCFPIYCSRLSRRYFSAQLTRRYKPVSINGYIRLLDIFVFNNSFEKSNLIDRCYPNILDFLSENEKKSIYYVPTPYKVKSYFRIYKKLRMAKQNILLKEDFLKLKDYFFATFYPFRFLRLKIKFPEYLNVNIVPLIKDEFCKSLSFSYYGSIESLLNYRFAKRLKGKCVNIKLVIDWFENQMVDYGANAGFRKYFPDVKIVGYEGFIASKHYLCMFPTTQEQNSKVIPQQIAVIGRGFVESVKRFCPTLDVIVAPAFRFQGIWSERQNYADPKSYTILVVLPFLLKESSEIIRLVSTAINNDEIKKIKNCRILIKQHPTNSSAEIKKTLGPLWTSQFEFTSINFNECVEKANLVISCASSACLEALAKGVPVVIVDSKSGFIFNPIPDEFEKDICICYSSDELRKAILSYRNINKRTSDRYDNIAKRIRENYFEIASEVSVKEFLNF